MYGNKQLAAPPMPMPTPVPVMPGPVLPAGPGTPQPPAWMAQNRKVYEGALAMQSASIDRACAANGPLSRQQGGGGQSASARDVAAVTALETGHYGAPALAPVISEGSGGPRMDHMYPTAMNAVSSARGSLSNGIDAQLAFLDPVGAAKLDAAMALTAVPGRFWNTEAQEDAEHMRQLAASMRMAGKIDLSMEEIMAARPVWVPTAEAMRRAVVRNGIDRSFQTAAVPTRLTYMDQFMGSRMATPAVQLNSDTALQEPVPAGLDAYVSSIACNVCPAKTSEPL
jgi:hypothetical protein